MSKPLEGIRVVEVAAWTFVPVAGAMLADMGAEVIKVEPPTGDPQRGLLNMLNRETKGPNPYVEIPNRGKRSITIDLKNEAGLETLYHLVKSADVFLTNYLPELRTKLKIDVDDIRAVNPDIVYTRGSGWGADGPMMNTGGYDSAASWAAAGVADYFSRYAGEEGLPPMPSAFFDLQGGNTIAGAISTALLKRERTGKTSVVDVSLLNVGMWAMAPAIVSAPFQPSDAPSLPDRKNVGNPITNSYRTKDDRWIFLVCLQGDRFWPEVCETIEHPELIDDPRFATADLRAENRQECIQVLDGIFATRELSEWVEKFQSFSGVWSPGVTVQEVHQHAQVRHSQFLQPLTDNAGTDFDIVSTAMHFDNQPTTPQGPAPEVGQDTEALLMETGMEWEQIEQLRESGALG